MEIELESEPETPAALEHVWAWFWELSQARTQSANGPNPISYSEIKNWSELTRTEIRPIEIEVIRRLDSTYMGFVGEQQQKETKQNQQQGQKQGKK